MMDEDLSDGPTGARLLVMPVDALCDEPFLVCAEGLPPRAVVRIVASVELPSGSRWVSGGWFLTSPTGVVDLTGDAPLDGSYSGVDPSGLLWSLRHDATSPPPIRNKRFLHEGLLPYDVEFQVLAAGGALLASATMTRRAVAADVRRFEVRERALHATLFLPPGRVDVVVVNLPGSDGGVPEQLSALFASRGYASLAVGYFGVQGSGLPLTLSRIPLEYFEHVYEWIRSRPELKRARLVLSGTSRGAELALLLASRTPEVAGVVALVPSAHVHDGFAGRVGEPAGAAWTHGGVDVPFVPSAPGAGETTEKGQVLAIRALDHLLTEVEAAAAEIPVENIQGPILLIGGGNDLIWPSGVYVRWMAQRLALKGFTHPVTALVFDGAGHTLGPPVNPTTDLQLVVRDPNSGTTTAFALGGDPASLARGQVDLWSSVLEFLERVRSNRD